MMNDLWEGLSPAARAALTQREYAVSDLASRVRTSGVNAGELIAGRSTLAAGWIPGVELFPRRVYAQNHRGFFGEFVRRDEGVLAELGFWPQQWATARMFAGSAKGFHIHPPHIPKGESPAAWFGRLFSEQSGNLSLRPYEREQWDVMFFVQGGVEMLLVDERAGLERRIMRFLVEGDDRRGPNNAGVVIPAGVAHALRVEGSADAIMVYGTTMTFNPQFEGRIADGIERAVLPPEWQAYLDRTD